MKSLRSLPPKKMKILKADEFEIRHTFLRILQKMFQANLRELYECALIFLLYIGRMLCLGIFFNPLGVLANGWCV